jgi:hypothetical protein
MGKRAGRRQAAEYLKGRQCGGFEVPIIMATSSFRNFKSKCRTRIIKLLVSL